MGEEQQEGQDQEEQDDDEEQEQQVDESEDDIELLAAKKAAKKAVKKAKKAKKKAKKAAKKPKKKRVSKIAKGRMAYSMLLKGKKEKTVGGLTAKDLTKNKYGKVVSKKASAKAKKSPWIA